MIILLLAFLIGAVAGLRAFTAPTAVSWAAHLGWLSLGGGPLAFLGFAWTPWILTILALVELVIDQLPSAPSRKAPGGFGARIVSGALSGAAIGAPVGWLIVGGIAGIVILGYRAWRRTLTSSTKRHSRSEDRPSWGHEEPFKMRRRTATTRDHRARAGLWRMSWCVSCATVKRAESSTRWPTQLWPRSVASPQSSPSTWPAIRA